MGLRDVRGDRDGDLGRAPGQAPPDAQHGRRGVHDPLQVGLLLRGQAEHEVELEAAPAAREHALGRAHEVGVRDILVDDIAQARRSCLRGEGQRRRAHGRELVEQAVRHAVGAQRGDGERGLPLAQHLHRPPYEGVEVRDVGRGQRRERGLVEASALNALAQRLQHRAGAALACRPVDHAGLAEATALGAAARHLDAGAVEHGLDAGHRADAGEGVRVQVGHPGAPHAAGRTLVGGRPDDHAPGLGVLGRAVQGGDVDRPPRSQLRQRLEARAPRARERRPLEHQIRELLLGLSDEERVEERRDRLGVRGAGPAAEDQRMSRAAVGCVERHAPEIEEGEDVRVGELVLQGDADDVELPERPGRLERAQRHAVLAQLRLHVHPRGERPFAGYARVSVEEVVEDLRAEVGHAHLVGVGEGEHDPRIDRRGVLDDGAVLTAQIARRPGDLVDEVGVGMAHRAAGCNGPGW